MLNHTISKATAFSIKCNEEVVGFSLQPVTFKRLIDINEILEGKELSTVVKDPTPLEVVKMAYCMFDKTDIEKLDAMDLKINNEIVKTEPVMKLYYLVTENNIEDGHTTLVSIMQAVNDNIISSFPKQVNNKKKTQILLMKIKSHWQSKKYLILLVVITHILLALFLKS